MDATTLFRVVELVEKLVRWLVRRYSRRLRLRALCLLRRLKRLVHQMADDLGAAQGAVENLTLLVQALRSQ